jgi:hypothetical protein
MIHELDPCPKSIMQGGTMRSFVVGALAGGGAVVLAAALDTGFVVSVGLAAGIGLAIGLATRAWQRARSG